MQLIGNNEFLNLMVMEHYAHLMNYASFYAVSSLTHILYCV